MSFESEYDDQYLAEILDEQSRDDEEPPLHIELVAPDLVGGLDDEAELLATEVSAEGPIAAEDDAIHPC
jgi:hypothetical protein